MGKELASAAAVVLTFVLFAPYIRSIHSGRTKPHVFSWAIWGGGTLVVCLAQLAAGGGPGAWVIGISGCITSYVAVLAYFRRSDTSITRADWVCLAAALSALPFWFVTSNPLWSVIILTTVDLLGFGPTLRTAYHRPHDERMWFYALGALRNVLVVAGLEARSLTTALFPIAVGVGCLIVVLLIAIRRHSWHEARSV